MPISYLDYELQDGFIQNWLTAGPQEIPISKGEHSPDVEFFRRVASLYYEEDSGIQETPVERGPLTEGIFKVGDFEGVWSYTRCREDHFIDHSAYHPFFYYLRSWANTQVLCEVALNAQLILTTYGPADVWINKEHAFRHEGFERLAPKSVSFPVQFLVGRNEILVRFENAGKRDIPLAISLQIQALEDAQKSETHAPVRAMRVQIPTLIDGRSIGRRNKLEATFETVFLEREICALDQPFTINWPEDLPVTASATVRLQTPSGRIYAEAEADGMPGEKRILSHPYQVPEGAYRVLLMSHPWEFYEQHLRITKELKSWGLNQKSFSESPYHTYEERRLEALSSAAGYRDQLFAEIAKMALGRWNRLDPRVIGLAIDSVRQCEDGSALTLLGLLGLQRRFGDRPEFPRELRKSIRECAVHFHYAEDEWEFPGAESQRILLPTCEVLAGQLYPDRNFSRSGKTGRWHRVRGEASALEWLHERGSHGFSEWDSDVSFAVMIAALSHLSDLAKSRQVWEMATVVMEKLFFTLAVNSFKGVFGSTRGWTRTASTQGGLLEATAGILRLMWGMGIYNHSIHGAVSLACAKKYELPPLFAEIAIRPLDEIWNRERHRISPSANPMAKEQEVNKVTYSTPDYMLCSVQDYDRGNRGYKEHIWQATLGSEAVAFVNHPGCSSEEDARTPNFWLGNAALPRVAQWKDVLVAIYHIPDDAWMGFTHAYFPTFAFDEYALRESADRQAWAFARKGDGYLALTASQGLALTRSGKFALRELRSIGRQNVWLCHMGRAAQDGDFRNFQERVLALEVKWEVQGLASKPSVLLSTLRGETLSFGWDGPFLRNGQEQPLKGFHHYENLYTVAGFPCEKMDIQTPNYLLRLNFKNGLED